MEDMKLAEKRWQELEALQEHYAVFADFAYDVITELLGFKCTDIQLDICEYLEGGPLYRMIQAQRGEAKTTLTAIYAVWRLIHNPRTRIVIISAGANLATQIANWIIQIIMYMPELDCMRPDKAAGDRASRLEFDLHHTLKGAEKSPSVACLGVTSSIQGYRADVLIADDIESKKNARTATARALLFELTKDFSSICSGGDIIYLGTPQSNDSVYNGLASRGFDIRIWPGRYPTVEELPNYGSFLAPLITQRLTDDPSLQSGGGVDGKRGKPTDPVMLDEHKLTKKELDQGKAYFNLQHMLDTKLTDENRFPLKLRDIVFMPIPKERAPITVNWSKVESNRLHPPIGFPVNDPMYIATGHSEEFGVWQGTVLYIDPAGGGKNGDETAYSGTSFLAGKIFLRAQGGIPGGYATENLEKLARIAKMLRPDRIIIEENFGKGAFAKVFTPILLKEYACTIEEVYETGQKELRIIDTLEPIIANQRLVVDPEILAQDWETVQKYPIELRPTYSLFFQLARITVERGALIHDDRLDALAGSCRHWVNALALDEQRAQARAKEEAYKRMTSDPLGNGRKIPGFSEYGMESMNRTDKFKLRIPNG